MNVERIKIQGKHGEVPAVLLTPLKSRGAAVIVHGIGSCKEEHLGLAWRTAELGLTTCAIDWRGHGENPIALDEKILCDVESAVDYCRGFGRVAAIGHSLGGRLALISSADFLIGLSPAIYQKVCSQTYENTKIFKAHRLREAVDTCEVFDNLPEWNAQKSKPALILYGSRDSQDIIAACDTLLESGFPVIKIAKALHGDIFLLDETWNYISNYLAKWFPEK